MQKIIVVYILGSDFLGERGDKMAVIPTAAVNPAFLKKLWKKKVLYLLA